MDEERDIVIVGAGPVGLSLALGLARRGLRPLVLEKEQSTAERSRAPAIWPAAQEALAQLGVIERFRRAGIELDRAEIWDADHERVLLTIPIEDLKGQTDQPRMLILPQSKTERFLYEAIRDETEAEVRFSSEVVAIEQDDHSVTAGYRRHGQNRSVRCRFAVGCDGARSLTREAIGGRLEGITYRMRAALADVAVPQSSDLRFPRLSTRDGPAIGIRIDSETWRLILPFAGEADDDQLSKLTRRAVRNLYQKDDYTPIWQSAFRLHRRVSTRWLAGRVVLAGDAAHLNSPAGGQGMNAGLLDSADLQCSLAQAFATDSIDPLESYVARRREKVEGGVNRFTDRLTRLLLGGSGRFIRPALRSANLMLRFPPTRRRSLRRLAMLDAR